MNKRYRIMNRITKEWWEGEASSAQEACQKAGWLIGDCSKQCSCCVLWIRQYSPKGYGGWMKPRERGEK